MRFAAFSVTSSGFSAPPRSSIALSANWASNVTACVRCSARKGTAGKSIPRKTLWSE
ncbi:MAG: hypothetical protein WCK73_17505 [Deltaproteobacteria bacterium]